MLLISPRTRISVLALLLVSLLAPHYLAAAQQPSRAVSSSTRPRLVLLIVADQFRYDYLERFGDLFGEKGLKRLMREGASWIETNYDHFPTYTAPGHATLLTGAYPAANGIVGNDWPDRDTGKKVSSVSDETSLVLGGSQADTGASPRRLLASTLGDELRLSTNDRSKVIGISLKDRAAILPAGRHANAAYWYSPHAGSMVSSDYYFKELPAWVAKFNAQRPADKFFKAKWERLLPQEEYQKRAGADSPPWEDIGKVAGDTNSFPHTITGGAAEPGPAFYNEVQFSPFGNEIELSFAKQTIEAEGLGRDEDPDVLSISFDANDYVGHRYGPYSQEVMDITLRFDQQIAELLDFVDSRIGLGNTIVVFTADHGVAPIPKQVLASGLAGGRADYAEIQRRVRAAISARYNPQAKSPDPTADYFFRYDDAGTTTDAIINNNIYFNLEALKRDRVEVEDIERVAGEAALTVAGVARYFTRGQLLRGGALASATGSSVDSVARRVQHGFFARRSGNVILVMEPYTYSSNAVNATHGSPYSYDTHVPLIIRGSGIAGGRYFQPATPADIAPTLAAILRIQAPSSVTGRILLEALGGKE
ncbi:MAG TPA: alkaline phosphatase family protein [Pyrinomonadaceae bacterium]|nr:alkaline phosphatase family protein [Pyrinomonadaceae bacterium]